MAGGETSGDKRQAILDAALELFAERGFHGTPVPMVAERAGVAAGTIYRYFDSKEALVNALYQRWKQTLVEKVLTDFPFDAPPRAQFRACWTRMARFAAEHPQAILFLELHHHAPYLDAESCAFEAKLMDMARGYVDAARAHEVLKDLHPDVLIALVQGAFVGFVKYASQGAFQLTDALVGAAEECVWEAIRR